jgi:hypothetical protein
MNKTKTPIPEIVEDGLACYELWVKAPRNKKFEMSQIRNSIQGGYRLEVRTPEFGMRIDFKPKRGSVSKQIKTFDGYRVVFGKRAMTFENLDKMLLWLYRRADSAQYISKPLSGVLGGVAWKLDRNYGRAHD